MFRTVRQGIGIGPPVKNEKMIIRKPDLPVPFEFFEKDHDFISLSQLLNSPKLFINGKEQLKSE